MGGNLLRGNLLLRDRDVLGRSRDVAAGADEVQRDRHP